MKASYPVLLVEDNPISRKMLEKILVQEGFSVTSVENGKEALAKFKQDFYPIVLTDWLMPETDFNGAMHLAERLRKVVSQTSFHIDNLEIQISASFGVSGFSPESLNANLSVVDLLKRVDKYLYQAKEGGRNRVAGEAIL